MERKAVSSSMIKSVGWEDGKLEVEFNSGKTYTYPVTEQEYQEFLKASSLGQHLNSHFKGRK